jgi:hypothetical protein
MRLTATIPMLALCTVSCVLRTPTLTARTPSFTSGSSSGPPPAPAGDSTVDSSQIIEAGCTFAGSEIKGEPGTIHHVSCPPGCDKAITTVFGTETYTSDSPVCAAAMHVGAISDRGGEATVMVEAGRPAYRGSKRNGVSSRDWGSYRGSFRFVGVQSPPPAPEVARGPVVIEAGCSFDANQIRGEPGSVYRVSCPAGCSANRSAVWGSNPFRGDSPICVASIHAGLTTDSGGEFTLILQEGRPA